MFRFELDEGKLCKLLIYTRLDMEEEFISGKKKQICFVGPSAAENEREVSKF